MEKISVPNKSWGVFEGTREWGGRGLVHVCTGLIGVGLILLIFNGIIDTMFMTVVVLSVSVAVLLIDHFRLLSYTVEMPGWFRWLDKNFSQKFFLRETERRAPCMVGKVSFGFILAWIFTTIWTTNTLWIFILVCLLFSFVDFFAKFGWRWPIKRFTSGLAEGKSWGGLLYGFLAGLLCMVTIFCLNYWVIPIFPLGVNPLVVLITYLVGAVSASLLELYTKKWDNLAIPAGSAFLMNLTFLIITFFTSLF